MRRRALRRRRRDRVWIGTAAGCLGLMLLLLAGASAAVIIDSGDGSGNVDPPSDFPWWQHVDQRLGGTTIIYLGNGWVLTARHVGMGILLFGDEKLAPDPTTAVLFGDPDRPADLILYRMSTEEPWPDVPLMPIAETAPAPGEEVLMIGNGRNRGDRARRRLQEGGDARGWLWGAGAMKRWGTNRVALVDQAIEHADTRTPAFATRFDSLFMGGATAHEAQAASGDSGGAVFKRRDPGDPQSEWVLAGVMFTVNHHEAGPEEAAIYGDFTYAVDLTKYRAQLIATVRPPCSNEADDDGDARVDFPADPGCESAFDLDEGDEPTTSAVGMPTWAQAAVVAAIALGVALGVALVIRASRRRR